MSEHKVADPGDGTDPGDETDPLFVPPEIWILIAKQLQTTHRKSLEAFSSTSHAFNKLSLPILHEDRILRLYNLDAFPDLLNPDSLPPGLQQTKDLKVLLRQPISRCGEPRRYICPVEHAQYVFFMDAILPLLNRVQTLEWHEDASLHTEGMALVLSNHQLLEQVKKLPSLQNLLIQFLSTNLRNPERERAIPRAFIPLDGFRNLTSLEIYDFHNQEDVLISSFVRVLSDSPNLKKLGLSLYSNRDEVTGRSILEFKGKFFEKLCLRYASRIGSRPLPVETLILRDGIYLSKPSRKDNYLAQLIKLDGLQSLLIYNLMRVKPGDDDTDYRKTMVDWSLLEDCKSLCRLSVWSLSPELRDWLSRPANVVQELIITGTHETYESQKELDVFNLLGINKLSMLAVDEHCFGHEFPFDDPNTSIDQPPETTDDITDSGGDDITDSCGDESGTEAKISKRDVPHITILNRISFKTDLSHLQKLSLSFEFEWQWEHFTETLPRLTSLNQLQLLSRRSLCGLNPENLLFPPISTLWPGLTGRETALRYAAAMHKLCPSLEYIKIGERAWRIPCGVWIDEFGHGLVRLRAVDLHCNQFFSLVKHRIMGRGEPFDWSQEDNFEEYEDWSEYEDEYEDEDEDEDDSGEDDDELGDDED